MSFEFTEGIGGRLSGMGTPLMMQSRCTNSSLGTLDANKICLVVEKALRHGLRAIERFAYLGHSGGGRSAHGDRHTVS